MDRDGLSERVIGAALAVHRELRPGLLESTYETCVGLELRTRGLAFERQVELPVIYRGARLDRAYRVDFVVEERLVLELKAVERFEPVHTAQVLTYLRLSGLSLGLLINFNTRLLKSGIRRIVHRLDPDPLGRRR